MADLSSEAVRRRLARLGELHVPETLEQARARIEAERSCGGSEDEARWRLVRLCALDEMARAQHRGRCPDDEHS